MEWKMGAKLTTNVEKSENISEPTEHTQHCCTWVDKNWTFFKKKINHSLEVLELVSCNRSDV